MYMLRLISAVLHRDVGPAVDPRSPDLTGAELGVLAPLVLLLIGLSIWPALITDRSFGPEPAQAVQSELAGSG
jgi:hypothetical protein